jgi:hypothetical protein
MLLGCVTRRGACEVNNNLYASSLRVLLAAMVLVALPICGGSPAAPDQPTQGTVAAFDRYVRLTEARFESERRKEGPYLWVDLQGANRERYRKQLHAGELVIESLKTLDGGKEIECPDGLIHHWMGTVFLPGVSYDRYLGFVQQYDRHDEYFKPDVQQSRLLERNGDFFRVFFRFYKKKAMITTVHDTEHDIRYFRLSPTRGGTVTRTTKVLDVENPGKESERHRAPSEDRGYLWRLYTWWRFEERDGGLYVQCESVSLTRGIPTGLGWLIGPFVNSVPRESLTVTLGNTRAVLVTTKP